MQISRSSGTSDKIVSGRGHVKDYPDNVWPEEIPEFETFFKSFTEISRHLEKQSWKQSVKQ